MQAGTAGDDASWSSAGLSHDEAIRQWQDWAAHALAPIDVRVADRSGFAAQWRNQSLGPLRFIQIGASAQRVINPGTASAPSADPAAGFQLCYARNTPLHTRAGGKPFTVRPGECVLLDNSRFYEMAMDDYHEAIDLVMPARWLARWLPDPTPFLDRPLCASNGWGGPLGSLMEAMAGQLDGAPLPRALLADQLGALLSLATGERPALPARPRARLTARILELIERDHEDPELRLDHVANALGISRRYVHILLAEAGTSFIRALNRVRLDHAAQRLADPGLMRLPIGEIAWQCGFSDAGYFARLFRRRHGMSPRDWRAGQRLQ